MKIYKLECLNEDGMIEVNGYYFDIQNAQKDAKELNESPRSKKYGIIHNVEEIETNDSPPPSTPLKQLSDEEIEKMVEGYVFSQTLGYSDGEYCKRDYLAGIKKGLSLFPQSDHINPIELLEWIQEECYFNGGKLNHYDSSASNPSQLIETFKNRK